MLTMIRELFTWWNRQTLGTRIKTFFTGKLIGEDEFGNKYYQNKKGTRWVIYNDQVEASKIPSEWFSWMHYTKNKIENVHELNKYNWQKPHKQNLTGTNKAYNPKNTNVNKKKYNIWKE